MSPTLTLAELSIGYADRTVLSGLNAELRAGELTVLLGANGCGKSTLLRTITGSQPALGGTVTLAGRPLRGYRPSELARHIALVLTDRTGGGGLRVDQLVAIGRHPYTGFMGRLGRADREAVEQAIERVGLGHRRDAYVASLSDGERQKAMVARAVAQDTDIIALDEPTSFLDVSARFEILKLLSSLARDQGKAILLSTHDTAAALEMADRLWAITLDGTLAQGTPAQLAEPIPASNPPEAQCVLDRIYPGATFSTAARDFRPMTKRP